MLSHLLCLNGSGYLQEVVESGDHVIARIKCITHFDMKALNQDDVFIDCVVKDETLRACFRQFHRFAQKRHAVLLVFSAEYCRLVKAQAGDVTEAVAQTLFLQGKLLAVERFFLDGQQIFSIAEFKRYFEKSSETQAA
jgi:hypothetical protein